MNKFNKNKAAVTLLSALAFGANAQAQDFNKNKITKTDNFSIIKDSKLGDKSPQTLGAVRGGAKNQTKKINWPKIAKIGGSSVAVLAALEAVHSIIGGFTDSKAGRYSIGRAIRNHVKKDNQPGSGDKIPEKINEDNESQKEDGEKPVDRKEVPQVPTSKFGPYYMANLNRFKNICDNLQCGHHEVVKNLEKFAELTAAKDSWKKMARYFYDGDRDAEYNYPMSSKRKDHITEEVLKKYEKEIEAFIDYLHGNSQVPVVGCNCGDPFGIEFEIEVDKQHSYFLSKWGESVKLSFSNFQIKNKQDTCKVFQINFDSGLLSAK